RDAPTLPRTGVWRVRRSVNRRRERVNDRCQLGNGSERGKDVGNALAELRIASRIAKAQRERQEQTAGRGKIGHGFTKSLQGGAPPHRTERAPEALHRSGRSLHASLFIAL